MKVGIIGLGLIGGSLARDLAAIGWRVCGADRDAATEDAARTEGVISPAFEPAELDVVVSAVPVGATPTVLADLAAALGGAAAAEWATGAGPVITDVGSTKRSTVAAAAGAGLADRFVGGHPVTGDHRSGWSASRTGLFDGASVWLCPSPGAAAEAVERVEALWRAVGAVPRRIDPEEHDRRLARSSHLPQLAATALAVSLDREGARRSELGPGGRDTTRLAGSDPEIWADILTDNADLILPPLRRLREVLREWEEALEAGDRAATHAHMAAGRDWSAAGESGTGGSGTGAD